MNILLIKKIVVWKIICVIIAYVVFCSFYQQTTDNTQIYWTNSKRLSWDDYLANPDTQDTSNLALTYYGIACSMKTKKDSVAITVRSLFDKSKSWVKPADRTDSLLMHEQGHFDITEIYSRILKKTLQETSFKKAVLSADFNQLYKMNAVNLNAEQGIYDEETDHGRIALKQTEWEKKIKERLLELKSYHGDKITAHLIH